MGLRDNQQVPAGIAPALVAHGLFELAMNDLHTWTAEDQHGEKALLLEILESAIRRREDGAWSHLDEKKFPPAGALRDALDPDRVEPIRKGLSQRRERIDDAARILIGILSSNFFLDALDELPLHEQIRWLSELSRGLAVSTPGLDFLMRTVTAAETPVDDPNRGGRIPAFHHTRLTDYDGDFIGDLDKVQKNVARTYAQLAQDLLPAVHAKAMLTGDNIQTFYCKQIAGKFYDLELVRESGFIQRDIVEITSDRELAELMEGLHRYDAEHSWVTSHYGRLAPHVTLLSGGFSLAAALVAVREDPSLRNTAIVATSVAQTTLDLIEAAPQLQRQLAGRILQSVVGREVAEELTERIAQRLAARLTTQLISRLNVVLTVIDSGWSFWDAGEDLAKGNTLEGIGHATEGVGILAAGTGIGAAAWFAATGTAVTVVSGGTLVAVGLGLMALGIVVQELADEQEPPQPFELFFRRCYFGTDGGDVDPDAPPNAFDFEWRRAGGAPDIGRQVSMYLSFLAPVNVLSARNEEDDCVVIVTPALASPYATVFLRFFDEDGSEVVTVEMPVLQTFDWEPPELVSSPEPVNLTPFKNQSVLGGEDRIENWECHFHPIPASVKWVEVAISLPSKLQDAVIRREIEGERKQPAHSLQLYTFGGTDMVQPLPDEE